MELELFLSHLLVDLKDIVSITETSIEIVPDNACLTLEQTARRRERRKEIEESSRARRQQQQGRWSSWTATINTAIDVVDSDDDSKWNANKRRVQSDSLLSRPMRASSPERCTSSTTSSATDGGSGGGKQALISGSGSSSTPVLGNASWDDASSHSKNQMFVAPMDSSNQKHLTSVDSVVMLRNVRLDKQFQQQSQPRNSPSSTTRNTHLPVANSFKTKTINSSFANPKRKQKDKIKGVLAALGPMAPPSTTSSKKKSRATKIKNSHQKITNRIGTSEKRFMPSSTQHAMNKPLHHHQTIRAV